MGILWAHMGAIGCIELRRHLFIMVTPLSPNCTVPAQIYPLPINDAHTYMYASGSLHKPIGNYMGIYIYIIIYIPITLFLY